MANKKTEEMAELPKNTEMTRPSFIPQDSAHGLEGLTKDDLQLPRFAIAQAMSPQLVKGDEKYIPGLSAGEAFNSLTGQNYGEGPFEVVVVRRDKPRGIQFGDRDAGGGVIDMDVPLTDPRMQFTTDPQTGKRVKPVATKLYDYIILLLPTKEMMALSFKSSGLKVAKTFNSLMSIRGTDIFAGRYTLTTKQIKAPKGTFFAFAVSNSVVRDEMASNPGWVSEALYEHAKATFNRIADVQFKIDREPGADDGDDATDFPTNM